MRNSVDCFRQERARCDRAWLCGGSSRKVGPVSRLFRCMRAPVGIIVVFSATVGAPVTVAAQDSALTHPTRLSLNVRVPSESSFQRPRTFRPPSPHRCSRLKAAIVGAAVGFGAGAVYGAVAGPSKFGVLGTRERTDALLFGVMGAGGGALIGVAVCS